MGWEERNGNQYYYSKRWQNGTCISEYMGSGSVAGEIDDLIQLDRERQQFERAKWQQEKAEIKAIEYQTDEVSSRIQKIIHAVLLATGHHTHKGQWRKKQMSKNQETKREQLTKEAYEFLSILQEGRGTDADVKKFKDDIKEIPALLNMFDMVKVAREAVVKKLSGDNQSLKLATLEIIKNTKTELGYDHSSQLEKLLIEQIILCHLRLYWVEGLFTQNLDQATMTQVQHWEKRLSVSQLRYFRAIETLARVRRLARKTPEILQVNVGEKQVNIVGDR